MEYIICEEIGGGGLISLYHIADRMACSDINDRGYLNLEGYQEKFAGRLEMLLSYARNGDLRVMSSNGITRTVDEIIAMIPATDCDGTACSREAREIFTALPMLNKWGESFGYKFALNVSASEQTEIVDGQVIRIGRKRDSSIPTPSDIDRTLKEAAAWLSDATGREWTDLGVLRRLYELAEPSANTCGSDNITGARFMVPKGTAFGIYKGMPERGGIFRSLRSVKDLPLSEEYARDLLRHSRADVRGGIINRDSDGLNFYVEPIGDSFPLTVDMVRICCDRLLGLLHIDMRKESRLMPVEHPFLHLETDVPEESDHTHDVSTTQAFDRISGEYSWHLGEWESLITDASDRHSAVIALLEKIRTRPLRNLYEPAIQEWRDHDAAVPIIGSTKASESVASGSPTGNTANESNVTPTLTSGDSPSESLPASQSADKPADTEINNWKMKIQAEATSMILRGRQNGAQPTKHSILGDLVSWCKKNEVKTPGGILPSSGYIRTHVLSGKHWEPPK